VLIVPRLGHNLTIVVHLAHWHSIMDWNIAIFNLLVGIHNLLQWLTGLGLSELQCSEPG